MHRAIDAAPGDLGLPLLPPYLERDHDHELQERVREAAAGRSTMVVLVGGSSTGKTRACWQAIHELPEGWRLWHPLDPALLAAALDTLPQVGPRTVIWLNETQHYLLTTDKLGERVAAGLRELRRDPQRGPVLVLGTLWPAYWATLTTAPAQDQDDPHAQARMLLTGTDIRVPDAFTGYALTALQAAAGKDPRLAQAQTHAQDGQITQFLAGVPVLLERYRNAPTAAKALIETAMDARRLGHSLALPHALLEAAVAGSLTDQQWDELGEDWLEQALAYTAAPCRGVRGPLTRIHPRPGQPLADGHYYRLSDYLEEHGRITRHPHSITAALWDALVAHATPRDLPQLGSQAQQRGLYRYAFQLYQAAVEAGQIGVHWAAAEVAEKAERTEEAITWMRARADAGDTTASHVTASLLAGAGRTEEAIVYFQLAAKGGDSYALREATRLLEQAGRTEEAITLLRSCAEAGDTTAIPEAARLMVEAGRTEEAITWVQTRAEAGDITAHREAARLLLRAERTEEAITYFQRAAEVGDAAALPLAVALSVKVARTEEAITWLQARAKAGDTDALWFAAHLLKRAGRTEEAITYLRRAAEAGEPPLMWKVAQLWAKMAQTE